MRRQHALHERPSGQPSPSPAVAAPHLPGIRQRAGDYHLGLLRGEPGNSRKHTVDHFPVLGT